MAQEAQAAQGEVLTFRIGEGDYAVAASDVAEVFRPPVLTRVPLAPSSLLGLTNLRGKVVPVVSLARSLGEAAGDATSRSRILLLRLDEPIAVAVDAVGALAKRDVGSEVSRRGAKAKGARGASALRVLELEDVIRREFAGLIGGGRRRTDEARESERRMPAAPRAAFLSFEISGQTYALPLQDVDEVFAAPDHIATLPGKDDAALGVMTLRDRLLPLLSLATLLGLPRSHAADHTARIVVARIGDARIGLVVDRAREILRAAEDTIAPVPGILNRGSGEAQIQSIHRLPDGRGMVSILSAERLFRDETVAGILAESRQKGPEMKPQAQARSHEQILVFQIGGETFGLPLEAVSEVIRLPDILTRVPKAPDFVLGVINHRGAMLPVIDQRSRLGLDGGSGSDRPRVLVTRLDAMQVGFVVDDVAGIRNLPAERVQETPGVTAEGARLFDRIAMLEMDGRMILLIEPRELLNRAEREVLAALGEGGRDASGP